MGHEAVAFFARFLSHPWRVGAVAPSAPALAMRAITPVPATGDPVVVELGPGTGAFTGVIQDRLGGRGYHLAMEIDPAFAAVVRRRHPRVDVPLWTPPGRRLREHLARTFEEVVAGRTVWANLPPALVYHARRPLRHDRAELVVHQAETVR
jgi:phosphatidylethanolamine/phosphatidyl-N-methylethanolamine N-methyltransferase